MLWSNVNGSAPITGDYREQTVGAMDAGLLMPTPRRPLIQANSIQSDSGAPIFPYMHAQGELFQSGEPPKDATVVASNDLEHAGMQYATRPGPPVGVNSHLFPLKTSVGAIGDGRKPKVPLVRDLPAHCFPGVILVRLR
jgi:hypothetical protein